MLSKKASLTILLGAIGGAVVATLVSKKIFKPKITYVGVLRVDNSDPEMPDSLFLELVTPVDSIKNSDYVTLKVTNENYIRN